MSGADGSANDSAYGRGKVNPMSVTSGNVLDTALSARFSSERLIEVGSNEPAWTPSGERDWIGFRAFKRGKNGEVFFVMRERIAVRALSAGGGAIHRETILPASQDDEGVWRLDLSGLERRIVEEIGAFRSRIRRIECESGYD